MVRTLSDFVLNNHTQPTAYLWNTHNSWKLYTGSCASVDTLQGGNGILNSMCEVIFAKITVNQRTQCKTFFISEFPT